MERAIALKKLGKLLGKRLGYKVDPNAPAPEEREAARVELTSALAEKKCISEELEARRKSILEADPQYQKLNSDYTAIRKRVDDLSWKARHKKICVGTSNELFFHVAAEGDSWEEVIELVAKKKAANQLL